MTYNSPCYCTNLRHSANRITQFYDRELETAGITAAQYYLLVSLREMGNANITHWAGKVGLERSTMVRNIGLLLKRQLIRQVDGHGKTYALTDSGAETMKTAGLAWERAQEKIAVFLGQKDAAALLRIGEKLQEFDF